MMQTYTNWELIFVDDNSNDGTIEKMMELKDNDNRIIISKTVYDRGASINRNCALRNAHGRWVAFLDAGDVWRPEKLERQIAFMEMNGYTFSYTSYGLMDDISESRGVMVSGKVHVTHGDMMRCCWPAYLTVMYDAERVGLVQVQNLKNNNDYALWLNISEKHDCHLMNENLAIKRTHWGRLGGLIRTDKVKWRYEVYRKEEGFGPVKSLLYTIRNGWYGIVKWRRYVKKVNGWESF
jgi:glycosyltransferase involved in cell wall biosynthesis